MENLISCPICMDRGYVLILKGLYETKYHCLCNEGVIHQYDGSECPENPSSFVCRSIEQVGGTYPEEIAKDNIQRYGLERVGRYYQRPSEPKLSPEQIADIRSLFSGVIGKGGIV